MLGIIKTQSNKNDKKTYWLCLQDGRPISLCTLHGGVPIFPQKE